MLSLGDSTNGVLVSPPTDRRWPAGIESESNKKEARFTIPRDRTWWFETARLCLAEFIGDMTFIFIGSLAVGTSSLNGGSASAITAAIGQGLTIAMLIISIGHISGGHYNPAVTIGFLLVKAIHPIRAICYIVSQLLGGFFGALFLRLVTSASLYESFFNGITTVVNPSQTSPGEAIACELILTYFLVQTVLCSFVDTDGKTVLGALAVGFVILVDILAGGDISGASMNPARSFGPALAASVYHSWSVSGRSVSHDPWTYHYVYWVGPIIGAVLAALVYKLVLANDEKRWTFRNVASKL